MARKLGEILQQVTERIPSGVSAPKRPISGECPVCGGAGWLRMDAEVGAANFGRIVPCECRMAQITEQNRREMEAASNMEAFTGSTFEAFDPGNQPTLRNALRVARDYATNPQGWLLLHGPCGTGKTHLAAAIGNYCFQEQGMSVYFNIVPELLDYLREAFNPNSEVTYHERFDKVRTVPLLVLDDLGTENTTPWAREKLYQIVNHRYNARLPTVVTTNQSPEAVDERIFSRISDRELVQHVLMDGPDYRHRNKPTAARRARRAYIWP